MARILGAAMLAAVVGLGPAAVSAASFQFTLELRFEVDAANFTGDVLQLDMSEDLAPAGPVESTSGSGAVSFLSELGGKDLAPVSGPPLLGIYRITGTGMTSALALGSAELELGRLPESELPPYIQSFSFFSFGGEPNVLVDLPLDLLWSVTVEASGGEWGDSAAAIGFSVLQFDGQGSSTLGPLAAESMFGEGRSEDSGSLSLSPFVGQEGTSALRITVDASGSARTVAPIPLPAGGWLILSGLGALVLARRRRR